MCEMAIVITVLFILIPNISRADLRLCGVNPSQNEFQTLLNCKEKERYQSSSETLKCYGETFSTAKKMLGSKTVGELSPLARYLLSGARKRYQKSDEENKLLSFYETTELHRLTKECIEGKSGPCLGSPDLQRKAKASLPHVEKLQTLHYVFFSSIGEINNLTKGATPLVSIRELPSKHRPKRSFEESLWHVRTADKE